MTPPDEWLPEAVHGKVCRLVQEAIETGGRIIITMPPQHGKSIIASMYAPIWYLWQNRTHNVALVTYSADLAEDKSMKARALARESIDRRLSNEARSRKNWALTNARDMSFRARGVGGGLTGNAIHFLILDDLIKNHEEAESESHRNKIWSYLESTLMTRLSDGAPVVAILTRWHLDDYATRMSEKWNWPIYNFPAICDDPETDLLGRQEGEAVAPRRHSAKTLLKVKRNVSPYVWNALYQGNPSSHEASRIKKEWFKYYDISPEEIARQYNTYQTVDTAGKDSETSDYFVVLTYAIIMKTLSGKIITSQQEWDKATATGEELARHIYVLDIFRSKVETTEHQAVLQIQREKWRPVTQYVESAVYGLNIIQQAEKDGLPIEPLKADASKFIRSEQISVYYKNGQVWHPKNAEWLESFEKEIVAFPVAKHDDQFDCISYAGILAARKQV